MLSLPTGALADSASTREALDRLEEIVEARLDDGSIDAKNIIPAILVSTQPRWAESEKWFAAAALSVLTRLFDTNGLRMCEACMVARTQVENGYLHYATGPISLEEIIELDANHRGDSLPARSAIWVDETASGVAFKIIDLQTARVIFAQNIDPQLSEHVNSAHSFNLSRELERRSRGDSLTHAFADFALYPGQHISLDWTEQWGPDNNNLSGITLSLLDPIVGIGAAYYRSLEIFNTLVGLKVILSVPTALSQALSDEDVELLDPIITGVFVTRIPFGRSNYGATITISTNGQVGLGISLLNISLLPVLP